MSGGVVGPGSPKTKTQNEPDKDGQPLATHAPQPRSTHIPTSELTFRGGQKDQYSNPDPSPAPNYNPNNRSLPATFEGHIQAGQPGTLTGTSISGDTVASCDPEHPLNGIDAVWFRLPDMTEEHHFRLEMPATLDVDVHFYNDDCT